MSGEFETRNEESEDASQMCKYGTKCYRKNPAHFEEYRHPGKYKVTCHIILWGSYHLIICTTPSSPLALQPAAGLNPSFLKLQCLGVNIGQLKKNYV